MKKFAKKALTGALSLAMVLGMTAVVSPETADAKKVKVKKVTVTSPSGKTAYVAKGKKIKLTATVKVKPNKKANKKVSYKSSNRKIATVNSKGQVKGVKVGSAKITVTSKKNSKKKATIKVVVKKTAVKKVKLNKKSASVAVGGKLTLKATVTPKSASKKIAWSSSKKKVATVSSKGVVKGKKEGTATITAKAADGSGKKATCKVTVGAGIKSVEVVNSTTVRVTLSSKKALSAGDFVIQNKKTQAGAYTTSETVEKVNTADTKTYDVKLDEQNSGIMSYSWLKVTVNPLKGNKSMEINVGAVPSLSYGVNDTITRVTGKVNDTYSEEWYLNGSINTTGVVTYNVEALPAGLKAYYSKDKTSVVVKGKFTSVLDGATAVLTGTDEAGKKFKRSYVFYVGDKGSIVGNFLDDTVLTYMQDDPNTKNIDEESGYNFSRIPTGDDESDIEALGNAVLAGGSGSYIYEIAGLPANVEPVVVDEVKEEWSEAESDTIEVPTGRKYCTGELKQKTDDKDNYLTTTAGDYPITVTVIDKYNEALRKTFTFKLTLTNGAKLTGTVKDASGAGVPFESPYGYTKRDAYGNYDSIVDAWGSTDGKYTARVIPGEYTTYLEYDNKYYDESLGNNITADATKDFTLPLYRVNFTTNIAGAAAYSFGGYSDWYYGGASVLNENGVAYSIKSDTLDSATRSFGLYAYLPAGTFEFSPSADDDDNIVFAYSKVNTVTNSDGSTYKNLLEEDLLPAGDGEKHGFKLSGSFTVAGAGTQQLTGTPYVPTTEG